jgi:hypothetical protein
MVDKRWRWVLLAALLLGPPPAGSLSAELSKQDWDSFRGAIEAAEPSLQELALAACRAIDPTSDPVACQPGPHATYTHVTRLAVAYKEYRCILKRRPPSQDEREIKVLVPSTLVRRDGKWQLRPLDFSPAAQPAPPPDSEFVFPSPLR